MFLEMWQMHITWDTWTTRTRNCCRIAIWYCKNISLLNTTPPDPLAVPPVSLAGSLPVPHCHEVTHHFHYPTMLYGFFVIISDKGGGTCFCLCLFVCLSVCVSKITQKRVRGFGWNVACRQQLWQYLTKFSYLKITERALSMTTALLAVLKEGTTRTDD